jgi:hypothetical protein
MGFRKIEKNTINYQPPTNDSLRFVSGNTALVTVIQQVVPLSGITNIGAGPGYIYKQTQNQIAEMMGISGNTNINIAYNSTGDTVGVNLNDNIIVNSISATTLYSGSTDLSLLIGGGSGSYTQYWTGASGFGSVVRNTPYTNNYITGDNSIIAAGKNNYISVDNSIIGGGQYNKVYSMFSSVLGGKNNETLNSSKYSSILGGSGNTIYSSKYSSIVSGKNNLINSGSDYSLISGKNNTISQPYAGLTFNHILGSNNQSNGSYINIFGNYNSGFTSNSNVRGKSNLIQGTLFGIYQLLYSTYGLNNIAGSRNKILNSGLSNIQNGFNNLIQNTSYSSILNGINSRIFESSHSFIAGPGSQSYSSIYSIILGPSNIITTGNTLFQTNNQIIGATSSIIKDASKSSILGGQLNGITGSTLTTGIGQTGQNVIIQGDFALIQGSRSSILNGFQNWILENSQDCTFISGKDNKIIGSQNSIVFNGQLNNVNYSTGVTLINVSNITTTSADTNLLITNKIKSIALTGGTTQMVVADSSGLLSVQAIPSGSSSVQVFSATTAGGIKQIYPVDTNIANNNNAISFGKNNKVLNKYSIITNGYYNLISSLGNYSNINNGVYNSINSLNFNAIANGSKNYISGGTNYQSVLNGKRNKIYSSYFSTINNGSRNYITSSNHSTILGGYRNAVTNNQHSTILNGSYNIIICTGSTDGNVIVNGDHNQIQSSIHSAILAGKYNVLSNSSYSSIISGSYNNFSGNNTAFGDKLQLKSLTGATTQMVVASTNGLLGIQNIPTSNSVNNGINTFTAGTSTFQSVNITGASLNNLTVSGITSLNTLSATTIYSGTTDLSTLFEPRQTNYRQTLLTNYVYTSSTAVANFTFPVLAGEVYKVEMFSIFSVNNTGGMKLTLSGNCLVTANIKGNTSTVLTSAIRAVNNTGNTTNLGAAANTIFPFELQGIFSARTDTTIALGFSPQTNGQTITVYSGATMILQKI